MATEYLLLRVDQRGARATAAAVRGVGTSAKQAHSSVALLRGALLTLGVGVGIRELKETVDTFIQIKNRVSLATNTTEEYVKVSAKLFDIAQDTRAPLEATAELYRRLAINTRGLNFSQERLLDLIKTINQSVVVSGATAKEARSGLIQLSQGFASGQIRGEEFRSVAEQLPGLLIAVADGLGKTIGELRELAFAGELTPELFAKAVESQAELIDATFQQIIPTIEQAGIQLGNAFIVFIGKINEATKGSESFRDVIAFIRDNMEEIATAAFSAAAGFGIYKVGALGAAAATRILATSIRSLLVSTGVGALIVALGLAVDALISFGLTTEEIEGVSVSGFNKIGAAVTAAGRTAKILVERFKEAYPQLIAGVKTVGRFLVGVFKTAFGINVKQFKGFVQNTKREINTLIALFVTIPEAFRLAWNNLPAAFGVVGIKIYNSLAKPIQNGVNALVREINEKLGTFLPEIQEINILAKFEDAGADVENLYNDIADAYQKNADKDFIGDFIGGVGALGADIGQVFTAEYNKALGETIELLQAEEAANKKKQEDLERIKNELTAIEEAEALNAKKTKAAQAAGRQLLGLTNRLKVQRERANDPLDASIEKYKQAADKARELGRLAGTAVSDNEALQLALEGQARVEQEKADLTLEQAELQATIAEKINEIAKVSPEFAQDMRDAADAVIETGGGLERIVTGLKGVEKKTDAELKRQSKELEKTADKIGSEIASGLSDAFRSSLRGEGFDWAEWLADKSAQLFEKSMEQVFSALAQSFQKLMQKAVDGISGPEGGGGGLGGFSGSLGAIVGVGGLLLSAALKKGETNITNELADQATAVTDVRPVRGVVAGPTNIPIFQLGQELEDALNPTNAILEEILAAIGSPLSNTAASAVSAEEEATQILNASSPTLI